MPEPLLTAMELAERLGVKPGTVRKWVREGRIPEIEFSAKVRRFDFAQVLQAIQNVTRKDGQ